MGIDRFLVSDFNLQSFKLSHDAPQRFVEPSIGRSVPLWYVYYRCAAAVYLSTSLVASLCLYLFSTKDVRYLLHFPVWGYSITTLYSILLAIQVYISYRRIRMSSKVAPATQQRKTAGIKRRRKKTKATPETRPSLSIALKVIWIMYYISLYSGLMTSVMYGVNLFEGVIRNSWPNPPYFTIEEVVIHLIYGPLTFLDFWVSGITIRLLHVLVMPCYSLFYNLVILCYTLYAPGETPLPLYNAADYRSGKRLLISILYFVGFAFITPIAVHFVYYILHIIKLYIADLIMYRLLPVLDAGHPTDAAQEAVPLPVGEDASAAAAAAAAAAESTEKEGVVNILGQKTTIPPTIIETEEMDIIVDPIVYT